MIGPLLAGLAVTLAGPALAIAADATTFAVLAAAAGWPGRQARAVAPGTSPPPGAGGPEQRARAPGFAVIAHSPALAGLLVLTLAYYFLYGPVEVALPLYVAGPLHGDAGWFGAQRTLLGSAATIALGLTAAGLLTTRTIHRRNTS